MLQGTLFLVLGACVLSASARVPSGEHIEELLNNIEERYSTDVNEDAKLNVPGLIKKYGYPLEIHDVTTEDGYILQIHRIPHGRDANNVPNVKKPVAFIMHGLLSSSADWVIMGPGSGFGYLLAEAGYDVWMGNARGNKYSRRHVRLNPDSILNTQFWDFSWDEIGNIDLPTMIDHALAVSGQERLHYIGHSQGTTSFFVLGSLRPEYNAKIISMHALAPVAYMAHNNNRFLNVISPHANSIESLASFIGIGEFMPNSIVFGWAGEAFCRDQVVTQEICSNILFLVGGWNENQHNATMLPAILSHTPAGAAVRQFAHYGQGIDKKEFRRYDMGSNLRNWNRYRSFTPPRYDLAQITTPVFLHYSDSDPLAEVPDVERLFQELGRPLKFRVPMATFSHLDFMWGIDAKELVYNRVLNLMRAMDTNTFDEKYIDSY